MTDRRSSNQEQWDRPVTNPVVVPDGRKGLNNQVVKRESWLIEPGLFDDPPPKRSLRFNRCEASLRAVLEQGVGE